MNSAIFTLASNAWARTLARERATTRETKATMQLARMWHTHLSCVLSRSAILLVVRSVHEAVWASVAPNRSLCPANLDDRNRRTRTVQVVTARGYWKSAFFIRTRITPVSTTPLSCPTTCSPDSSVRLITWSAGARPTIADDGRR